jgi:hypothetical protein
MIITSVISRTENALLNHVMVSASDLEQLDKLKFIVLGF